jgi:hypothetical protein
MRYKLGSEISKMNSNLEREGAQLEPVNGDDSDYTIFCYT